jgi:hypothetical protein
MLIEHMGLLSCVYERTARDLKQKRPSQDGGMLVEGQHPAILPWSLISDGVHPLVSLGHLAPPSGRIAAGRLLA